MGGGGQFLGLRMGMGLGLLEERCDFGSLGGKEWADPVDVPGDDLEPFLRLWWMRYALGVD